MKYKFFLFLLFILNLKSSEISKISEKSGLQKFFKEKNIMVNLSSSSSYDLKKAVEDIIDYLCKNNIDNFDDQEILAHLNDYVGLFPILELANKYSQKKTEEDNKKFVHIKSIIQYMINNNKEKQDMINWLLKYSTEANEPENIKFYTECGGNLQ